MIVAERKPLDQILQALAPFRRILVLGCGSCVTVCLAGGEKQADELAAQLRLAARQKGLDLTVEVDCITRQCDREFARNLKADPSTYDAVLSIACGVGVGFMSELFPQVPVLPGLNTTFYGANVASGVWAEYCHGCGDCVLAWTGGICPIARCSKQLLNGPCGGSQNGKCEVSKETSCAWQLIWERMTALGMLDRLMQIQPPKDWRTSRDGGPRRIVRDDLRLPEEYRD